MKEEPNPVARPIPLRAWVSLMSAPRMITKPFQNYMMPKTQRDLLNAACEKIGGENGAKLRRHIESMPSLLRKVEWHQELSEHEYALYLETLDDELPELRSVSEMSDKEFARFAQTIEKGQLRALSFFKPTIARPESDHSKN